MRRADRLIKLVHFLRRRRRAVTAQRIAEEFDICTRTVYRDIQDLMDSGVPITGEAGVGYFIDKQYYLPPVTFDADELEAIGLGISMVRHWTDEKFAQQAESAFEKIRAVLPQKIQGDMEQITTFSMPTQNMPPWSVSFSDLRESIRAKRKIEIEYTDEKQEVTTRVVHPLALIFFSPVWLLAGWCEKRKDFRHFRLDRMRTLRICDECFEDDPDKNYSAYIARQEGCSD